MHRRAPCGCRISSAITSLPDNRPSASPKTKKPPPHPLNEDPNRDIGVENSTSNRRSLVRNRRKQTWLQNKATLPVGAPGLGTCPKSPRALRRCAELLGTWQKTKRPPSSTRQHR